MMRDELLKLREELASLAVFRQLLSNGVIRSLIKYLDSVCAESYDLCDAVSAYSEFVGNLYENGDGDLSSYIESIVNNSENIYVRIIGSCKTPPEEIARSTERELEILSRAAALTPDELAEPLCDSASLPRFSSRKTDIAAAYRYRTENIGKYGYGKYASNRMFYVDNDGAIIPVKYSDPITLDSLVDYENERRKIVENTKALLDGKPAANILLTGDAGTGKSSSIKAVGNEFYPFGLRIIEVRKDQLAIIPKILDELANNPLKFILFIDDLSFLTDDDNFNGLKAVLEGSVSARSHNVAVYATSNRRHLVKEKFSDREGDDVHVNDTLQEIVSLSNRFGLHITFEKPDKKTYLDIVRNLAEKRGVKMPKDDLESEAEKFALERGGRSARLACQLIDRILSDEG